MARVTFTKQDKTILAALVDQDSIKASAHWQPWSSESAKQMIAKFRAIAQTPIHWPEELVLWPLLERLIPLSRAKRWHKEHIYKYICAVCSRPLLHMSRFEFIMLPLCLKHRAAFKHWLNYSSLLARRIPITDEQINRVIGWYKAHLDGNTPSLNICSQCSGKSYEALIRRLKNGDTTVSCLQCIDYGVNYG